MDFKEKREKMFNIGSYVMYGKRGVCKVGISESFLKSLWGTAEIITGCRRFL